MASFVLVHGAWHGAWCWTQVIDELNKCGHHCVAVDLPGVSSHPCAEAPSLPDCVATVVRTIDRFGEKVILVGHSLGGTVVAQTCEAIPASIASAIYVAASLPCDGQSHLMALGDDPASLVAEALLVDATGQWAKVDPAARGPAFYSDCNDHAVKLALQQLADWQALAPAAMPVCLGTGFSSVRRHYVECTEDRTISIGVQRRMARNCGVDSVASLVSGHSPFLSQPKVLAAVFNRLVKELS